MYPSFRQLGQQDYVACHTHNQAMCQRCGTIWLLDLLSLLNAVCAKCYAVCLIVVVVQTNFHESQNSTEILFIKRFVASWNSTEFTVQQLFTLFPKLKTQLFVSSSWIFLLFFTEIVLYLFDFSRFNLLCCCFFLRLPSF